MVAPGLENASILHLTDFHIAGPWRSDRRLTAMLEIVRSTDFDMACLTGDYVEHLGFEDEAIDLIRHIHDAAHPRLGFFGVFGNHDPPELIERAERETGVRWLVNRSVRVDALHITGVSEPEDLLTAVRTGDTVSPRDSAASPHFRVLLAHYPTNIVPAAAMGFDLVLAGHTHGGQIRVSKRLMPHTSCDLTPRTGSGMLRLNGTLCCISRGLGETVLPIRFRCPPQVGLYRLVRGAMLPGGPGISRVVDW